MTKLKLFSLHSWIGLIAAIPLLFMGVSGSILAFHEEIDGFLYKEHMRVKPEGDWQNLDGAYRSVYDLYPDWEIRFREIPPEPDRSFLIDLRKPGQRKLLFVHPQNGRIMKVMQESDYFTIWLLKFHYSLFMGFYGKLFVFIAGLLFILAIVSGILLYRKAIVKVLSFKLNIQTRNSRLFYSSLHRIVGVWSLLANLVLAISGTIISFVVVSGHTDVKDGQAETSVKVTTSLVLAREHIAAQYPGLKIEYARISGKPGSPVYFYGSRKEDFWLWSRYANVIGVDPHSGEIKSAHFLKDQGAWEKFMDMIFPLHFGSYGGLPIKIMYSLAGLSPSFLAITGFYVFMKRRNRIRSNYKRKKILSWRGTYKQNVLRP